ncbi:MAG: hypothetical protein M3406_02920 [Chloroflexota bacterium]|nr:hypothetical protein [Chloroflexota bacterium]
MNRLVRPALAALLIAALGACGAEESPSPSASASVEQPTTPPSAEASPSPVPSDSASPTPTPAPSLSLEPPEETDDRVVTAAVAPEIGEEGGTLTVTVTSAAPERIDELVLRWPTELSETLFIAPFTPTEERIAEGGPPLVQPWTKWVVGPGEKGEPEGTTSIGWGPLFPDATLTIELDVTREATGPVEFDLQILADNALLTLDDGEPAELRVEVP